MGRATRWFKSLLGMKGRREKMAEKSWSSNNNNPGKEDTHERENQWLRDYITETEDEQSKHAIAVAAATAAAADAAVAAAQAAVAVVRLTAHGRDALFSRGRERKRGERWAAVKIQTFFRGYLARKALRALKALVKLQAHVRGYLVRKRAAATLRSMQALIRAQAAVRTRRANQKTTKLQSEFRPRRSIERLEETRSELVHSKRISTSYHEANNANEGNPKIVEVDTYKPRSRSRRINPSLYDFTSEDFLQYPTMSSPLPSPALARLSIPDPPRDIQHHDYDSRFYGDEYRILTAHSTPRFANSGPITPTKSVCGESCFGPNHPNYMADTHSFRAKLRAQSVPKQRPDVRPKKKLSLHEIMAARNSISSVRMHRSCPQVQDTLNF